MTEAARPNKLTRRLERPPSNRYFSINALLGHYQLFGSGRVIEWRLNDSTVVFFTGHPKGEKTHRSFEKENSYAERRS
jgi:hypothetical protein